MRKKYLISVLIILLLVSILALIDLDRQQSLAEDYATQQLVRIAATQTTLNDWNLPKGLLGIQPVRGDTNYTFTQWEIVFSTPEKDFIQVFVKPANHFIIPVLNFSADFEIDRIHFAQSD